MGWSLRSELLGALLGLLLATPQGHAATRSELATGERLYRHGLTHSGAPVHAIVEGDVELSGEQFSCVACHGRSGLGSIEGKKVVPPIASTFLAAPHTLHSRPRPAYTDKALVRALREGIDAAGNPLDPLMPRYKLSDADARALVAYLRQLSARPSDGVQGQTLHFATVVAPGAAPLERDAMLAVLASYFRLKSAAASDHRSRLIKSWPDFYGQWDLHVWTLTGPPGTWRRQLEADYRSRPVFAVVSGIGGNDWAPIQRFCEDRQLPCLLPNVDTPPSDAAQASYSLYFSGGTLLEARAIATRLSREASAQRVLQVFVRGGDGERAAHELAQALKAHGGDESVEWALSDAHALSADPLALHASEARASAVVLWLGPGVPSGAASKLTVPVYLSSTLRGDAAPAPLGAKEGFVVRPYALQTEVEPRFRRVSSWLASQKIAATPEVRRVEDQTFFALTVLSEGFMHLKKNFLRDYLLESVDHFSGFENFTAYYPRLSFGPGQRLLSKGCYFVPIGSSTAQPEWVVP